MSRRKILLSALLFLLIPLLHTGKPVYAAVDKSAMICGGVKIDEVDVSGMSRDGANEAVTDFVAGLQKKGVAITVGDNVVYTTMGDLGYTANPGDAVDKALNLGKTGNLIKRYKDLKDIEQGNVSLPLDFTYDKNKIKKIVEKDVSEYNIKPLNASVSIKNGKLVYTKEALGSKVNVDETSKSIENAIENWNREDIVVDASVEDVQPEITKDIVEKCNKILGSYTTEYASSAQGRAANLANGARLINNTVLDPGEEFSAYDHLSPFTEENGYFVAGAYLKGKVIDSVGGGACQVTTTLYNAVLKAELEVTQRQSHSMTISYVDLSRDAAIAGTSKNFKFKNNTDVPILIQAFTNNRKITFRIWGHETRDTENRKIEFVTKILSTTKPPADIITKDPTKPTDFSEVTTPAHAGYKAQLYKVVYKKGVEVERILVNTSHYQAAAKCITVGTKAADEDKKAIEDAKSKDKAKTDTNSTDTDPNTNGETNTETDNKSDIEGQTDLQ